MEPSSTCVYYQFTEGLADITPKSSSARLDRKREKLDSEIRKLTPLIQQTALCGLSLPAFEKQSSSKEAP